jgi:hypothetical protein
MAPSIKLKTLNTMNIYDDYHEEQPSMDESMWEDMTIPEQVAYLNRTWEEKTGEIAYEDCDEGDWGTVRELDEADYYSLSPNGDAIPW